MGNGVIGQDSESGAAGGGSASGQLLSFQVCSLCELTGHAGDAAEAAYFVSIHDHLHHGGSFGGARVAV